MANERKMLAKCRREKAEEEALDYVPPQTTRFLLPTPNVIPDLPLVFPQPSTSTNPPVDQLPGATYKHKPKKHHTPNSGVPFVALEDDDPTRTPQGHFSALDVRGYPTHTSRSGGPEVPVVPGWETPDENEARRQRKAVRRLSRTADGTPRVTLTLPTPLPTPSASAPLDSKKAKKRRKKAEELWKRQKHIRKMQKKKDKCHTLVHS